MPAVRSTSNDVRLRATVDGLPAELTTQPRGPDGQPVIAIDNERV